MAEDRPRVETKWFTGKVQHEGFPLHLRFPEKPNFDSLQSKYPKLLVVKQTLTKVTSSGEPEPDYNDTLADFDHDLINAFDPSSSGLTVLVETFAGKRTYYIYISQDSNVEKTKKRFSSKYPQHQLEWKLRDDPKWKFIRGYSYDYKFYTNG